MELKEIEELVVVMLKQIDAIKQATDINGETSRVLLGMVRLLAERTARIERKVDKMRPN